jgi:flavin reductase (DIM6/NTAB) family NADH-FMN oxidoreductase RutF
LANFSCVKHRFVDAGDHLILIGRVLGFEVNPSTPLRRYISTNPGISLEVTATQKQKYKI